MSARAVYGDWQVVVVRMGMDGSGWNANRQGGEMEGKCNRTRTWLGLPPLDNALLCSAISSFSPFLPIAAFRHPAHLYRSC